jgi:hypothetical protein
VDQKDDMIEEQPVADEETADASAPADTSEKEQAEAAASEIEEGEGEQAAEEAPAPQDPLVTVVERIRADSREARLTDPDIFSGEPYGFSDEELEEIFDDMTQEENASDIVRTRDERDGKVYLHSEALLTIPYAKLVLRKQADDPVYMIVATVREHSQLYPQPLSVAVFELEPFSLVLDDVMIHAQTIRSTEAYSDIKQFETSNGVLYLYSDRYMSEEAARAKAEWVEVDQFLNP